MLPLEGLLVVSLEHAIAAPLATRHLADLGARVIKIERPEGGDFARAYDQRARGVASHFAWCNRSKESLTLDVKHPQANAALMKLVAKADVLVQNLAPGAAARLGLSYEALSALYPRIIVCDISGYGDSGPYVEKKAYDLLIQAESGFLSITGTADAPAKAGNSIADISAGMYAYSGILAALLERGRTGRGRRVDIALLESMTGGWAIRCISGWTAQHRRRAAVRRTPRSTPMARSRPATAAACCWACRMIASGSSSRASCCSVPNWRTTGASPETRRAWRIGS